MKYQAVRIDFTPKELKYFLFAKKICPRCSGRLIRSKEYETRYGWEFHETREPFLADNERVKYYSYYFTCAGCGRKYPLRELVGEGE